MFAKVADRVQMEIYIQQWMSDSSSAMTDRESGVIAKMWSKIYKGLWVL